MRVYVSSSFRDLEPERAAVLRAIRGLGHTAIGMEDYGADHRRPAERCAEDVRSCDAYVLLVAWRAGSAPTDGGGRTYTEIEYATAVSANLRPLVYLSPERSAWTGRALDEPGGRIDAFRARVAEAHMARPFKDATDLALVVTADVHRTLGESARSASVPDLFPYLCDRSAQRTAVRRALRASSDGAAWAPLLLVAHGSERQAVDRLLECVREEDVPSVVGGRIRCAGFADVAVDLAHATSDDPTGDLVAALAERPLVFPHVTSVDEVLATLRRLPGPLLVRYQLPHDAWSDRVPALLDAFFALFGRDGLRCPHPVIAVAWAQYRDATGGFFERRRVARTNATLRTLVESRSPRALVLPELVDVSRDDVEAWTIDARYPRHLPKPTKEAVRVLFGAAAHLPMERVGEGLREILDRTHLAEGAGR